LTHNVVGTVGDATSGGGKVVGAVARGRANPGQGGGLKWVVGSGGGEGDAPLIGKGKHKNGGEKK